MTSFHSSLKAKEAEDATVLSESWGPRMKSPDIWVQEKIGSGYRIEQALPSSKPLTHWRHLWTCWSLLSLLGGVAFSPFKEPLELELGSCDPAWMNAGNWTLTFCKNSVLQQVHLESETSLPALPGLDITKMFYQPSGYPLALSSWFIKSTITPETSARCSLWTYNGGFISGESLPHTLEPVNLSLEEEHRTLIEGARMYPRFLPGRQLPAETLREWRSPLRTVGIISLTPVHDKPVGRGALWLGLGLLPWAGEDLTWNWPIERACWTNSSEPGKNWDHR